MCKRAKSLVSSSRGLIYLTWETYHQNDYNTYCTDAACLGDYEVCINTAVILIDCPRMRVEVFRRSNSLAVVLAQAVMDELSVK